MSHHAQVMTLAQWAGGDNWHLELQHSEKSNVLIWVTKGQGRCVIEGIRRGLGVHNALAIPAGTMFSLELGKQAFGLVCLLPAESNLLMPDTPCHLRIRDVQSQAELTGIFEAMQREQNNNRAFVDEALNAQASLVTVWLRRAIIDHNEAAQDASGPERLVNAYSALVERDYATGKTMADLAGTLGVTPTHLTRTCRQCAGLTAAEMLTERSLHAARDMLEHGDNPMRQVAACLGFNSAAYFSRFVQHHTGHSPSELRKKAQARAAA